MIRPAFIPFIAATLGILSVLGYSYATRTPTDSPGSDRKLTSPPDTPQVAGRIGAHTDAAPSGAQQAGAPPPAEAPSHSSEASNPKTVAGWIADTSSADAQTRAAAIAALAEAPRTQAIPVLKQVLEEGEPEIDRQTALRSLHTIALKQGDENGRIRDVLRRAMYHGDDEGVSQSAQALLEDIEADLALRTPDR